MLSADCLDFYGRMYFEIRLKTNGKAFDGFLEWKTIPKPACQLWMVLRVLTQNQINDVWSLDIHGKGKCPRFESQYQMQAVLFFWDGQGPTANFHDIRAC